MKFTQGSPSLSSKISDKNRRENQIKTRWERSGRHNEIGMECGKHKDERRCCGEMKIFKAAGRCNGGEPGRVDNYIQEGTKEFKLSESCCHSRYRYLLQRLSSIVP